MRHETSLHIHIHMFVLYIYRYTVPERNGDGIGSPLVSIHSYEDVATLAVAG